MGEAEDAPRSPASPSWSSPLPSHAWCLDLLHERLENGRACRVLGVLDCFTRECLMVEPWVHHSGSARRRDLEKLFLVHGNPTRLVSGNDPEFRSLRLTQRVEAGLIQPGSLWAEWQNRELSLQAEGLGIEPRILYLRGGGPEGSRRAHGFPQPFEALPKPEGARLLGHTGFPARASAKGEAIHQYWL